MPNFYKTPVGRHPHEAPLGQFLGSMAYQDIKDFQAKLGAGSPYVSNQTGVSAGLAPNGTIAANGQVTLDTALDTTYDRGIWLRFPAGAVSGGSAGLYWVVMSSTTVGQVYTNFTDASAAFIPYVPSGTLVAAVGSGSAYTQTTAAYITVINMTLAANALGSNGALRYNYRLKYNLAAGNKLLNRYLNGVSLTVSTRTTSGGHDSMTDRLQMAGATDRQWFAALAESSSQGSLGANMYTVDMTADRMLALALQLDTATNWVIISGFSPEILPA